MQPVLLDTSVYITALRMSAGRLGITVITANARDFGKLAEFRHFQWRVNDPRSK